MQYKTEDEFLKAYNSDQFEKLSLTTDILIFSISSANQNNYRKLNKKYCSILLVKRNDFPFKDHWCLPGGFVGINESIDDATKRILTSETNLKDIYLEQLYTFGDVKRDPRMRIISTAHLALIDKNKLNYKLNHKAEWFNVEVFEKDNYIDIILSNDNTSFSYQVKKVRLDKPSNRYDYEVIGQSPLAFDHARVIAYGLERIKNKIEYTDIAFHLMPEYFTLGELQQVYEVILGKKLLDPAFRRIIQDKVIKTEKMQTGGGHRPSALFKYKKS